MRAAGLRGLAAALGLGALLGAAPPTAGLAQPIVADLSNHLIAITTGFVGTDVLLFGALDAEGEVVVVVRGPERPVTVRRKDRVSGLWINTAEMTFERAPGFYAVAANRPLEELASQAVMQRHGIGLTNLTLEPEAEGRTAVQIGAFRTALIRNKQREGLYAVRPYPVTFLTGRLFRADLHFPENVPVGAYTVEVYLIQDGEVASAQTTPLAISKVGVGADIFFFAHRQSAAYGLVAITVALIAGWAASAAFRRS